MKVRDYIAEAPAEREPSAVCRMQERWQWFGLWWQITFGDPVELEDSALREVQRVWVSFGEVSVHEDPEGYVARLQATAATANRLLGDDAWQYLCLMGVNYQSAIDHDARAEWRRALELAQSCPSPVVRKARYKKLSDLIQSHFSRFPEPPSSHAHPDGP